jgi:hypothetical protein
MAGAVGVLALMAPATGVARQDRSVPREVIAILLEGLERGGFDLRLGDALEFPDDLLPAGAEIAVSAVGDETTTVVATTPTLSASARVDYEQRLVAAGWTNPERPTGFMASATGPLVTVCRGSEFATVSFSPRPAGGSYVRAAVMTDTRRACAAQPSTAYAEMPLPSLAAPVGAVTGRASMGGTSDTVYSAVRIRTDIPVEAVGSHYAEQLTTAGWRVEGQSGDPGAVSVTRLGATSPAGEAVTGLLVVTAIDGTGDLDVMLRVVRHTEGRR